MKTAKLALCCVLGLLWIGQAHAQSDQAEGSASPNALSGEEWLLYKMQSHFSGRKAVEVDELKRRMVALFLQSDVDGNGYSQSDWEAAQALAKARRRGQHLGTWFQRDIDGDSKISRDELEMFYSLQARRPLKTAAGTVAPTEEQVAKTLASVVAKAMVADKNSDGVIDLSEIIAAASDAAASEMMRYARPPQAAIPKSLDRDGDGTVSWAEFTAAVEALTSTIDTDGDGIISISEATSAKGRAEAARVKWQLWQQEERNAIALQEKVKACGFSAVPENAEFVLLEVNRGTALSTVGLGDKGRQVNVVDLHIEPGSTPLYVMVNSVQSVIWRASGDVDRVRTFVVGTRSWTREKKPIVGVTGIEETRVHFVPRSDCIPSFEAQDSARAIKAVEFLSTALGMKPDRPFTYETAGTVHLPSGKIDKADLLPDAKPVPTNFPAASIWPRLHNSFPGGIVPIDPKAVVSQLPTFEYSSLPGYAGLAHLVESGALRVLRTKQALLYGGSMIVGGGGADTIVLPEHAEAKVVEMPTDYLVLKKMTFPPSLPHLTKFVLAPGVPMPEGNPGRTCVIEQDSGKVLNGLRC